MLVVPSIGKICVRLVSRGELMTPQTKGLWNFQMRDPVFSKRSLGLKFKNSRHISDPAGLCPVDVYESFGKHSFCQIFTGYGLSFGKICVSEDQIRTLCEERREWFTATTLPTVFLVRRGKNLFTAQVSVGSSGKFTVCVHSVRDQTFRSRRSPVRVMIPQFA